MGIGESVKEAEAERREETRSLGLGFGNII